LPKDTRILSIFDILEKYKHSPSESHLYIQSSKSILSWLFSALTSYQTYGISNYLDVAILKVLEMQESSDQDLSGIASIVAKIFPNFLHDGYQLNAIFETLTQVCLKKSLQTWHAKIRVLPILQVLFFRHLFLLSTESKSMMMDTLYKLISDSQVEVRQLASITISGLVQCSERSAIESLIHRFEARLKEFQLPKRNRNDPITPEYSQLINQKHSAVLGLSSVVLAFPYEVPVWMPSVLVSLASCASDPSPIKVTLEY
jgi:proteasome activator subunit 4